MTVRIDSLLPRVQKPARYAGGEWNSIVKDWDATPVRVALCYPDIYDIGMSNLGLGILYDLCNREPDVLAERCYAPWTDMEAAMRAEGVPLWSLETRHPLRQFDLVGFSLQYEMDYANVLNMLDLGGIPVLAEDRAERDPIVLAGGSGALNPEPMHRFIDAFVLGEAEELMLEILDVVRRLKREGGSRAELLHALAQLRGVYVPRFYAVDYNPDGTPRPARRLRDDVPLPLQRRLVDAMPAPLTRPVVPYLQTVHDRATVEIQRGCTQGCRFCQAGMIYRPSRERSPREVRDAVRELLANTGYDEVSLMSLSTTDHTRIGEIVRLLMDEFGDRGLRVSLPSTRVDSFSVDIAEQVARGKKHNITFAPEAGSQRMRDVINKLVSDDDLLNACENAFSHGWTGIKLYFMVGLPTETPEDVAAIAELGGKVKAIGRKYHGGRARVRVSTSNFIPKPHTPFQWCAMATAEELRPRHQILADRCRAYGVEFSWNDPRASLLEALISRGDRRMADVIYRAWQLGARFDAWSELHDWSRWRQALDDCGLDIGWYAYRQRDLFETLPWSHIEAGVTAAYLRREWHRTLNRARTLDCHREDCNVCGMQGFGAEQCELQFDMLAAARRAAKAGEVIPLDVVAAR